MKLVNLTKFCNELHKMTQAAGTVYIDCGRLMEILLRCFEEVGNESKSD